MTIKNIRQVRVNIGMILVMKFRIDHERNRKTI